MTKISVIVPVYNVEAYLPKCISSLVKQTFTDFEVILVLIVRLSFVKVMLTNTRCSSKVIPSQMVGCQMRVILGCNMQLDNMSCF